MRVQDAGFSGSPPVARPLSSVAIAGGVRPSIITAKPVDPRQYRLGFTLFMLVNATLFLRPGELFPQLGDLPIYESLIAGALIAAFPVVLKQLSPKRLWARPWTLCVLGMLPAIMLSNLSHGDTWSARMGAMGFSKILIFYLLLVGLVNSPKRLRTFLLITVAFITLTAGLAILRYHGYIQIKALSALNENGGMNDDTGEQEVIVRLQASGVFSDPNDFSLVLAVGMLVLGAMVIQHRSWIMKGLLVLPVPVLFYAFALTKSRGGFLALLAGGGSLLTLRFGWRKALLIGLVFLPVLVIAAGGRQTDIDLNDSQDTAVGRILLWRDGLMYLKSAPVFGIGWSQFAEQSGLVAHNSYVHTFAELGFFGGCMFLGCFFVPMKALAKLGKAQPPLPSELAVWRPCIFAIGTAYAVGLFSLSRPYVAPTYLDIGAVGAYCGMVANLRPNLMAPLSGRLIGQLIVAGIGMVILVMCFVKLFAH